MARSLRGVARSLPPIRWRDERIAALERRVAELEAEDVRLRRAVHAGRRTARTQRARLEDAGAEIGELRADLADVFGSYPRASFHRMLCWERRLTVRGLSGTPDDAPAGLTHKLAAQELVRSLGVRTPQVYRRWESLDEVDLTGLPDELVLKSVGGASSRGVLPLRREGSGFALLGTDDVLTPEGVRERFARYAERDVVPPFFAEERITGVTGDALPVDIKVYAFHGEIGQILLRRVGRHGVGKTVTTRYVTATGEDLGPVSTTRPYDETIPVPRDLEGVVETARVLSTAVRLPFVRIDLFESPDGIVFGEFTPRPGGPQKYERAHDERMGLLWEDALVRLRAAPRTRGRG